MSNYLDLYTTAIVQMRESISFKALHSFAAFLSQYEHIFTFGKGRTGLVMDMFAMRLGHLGRSADCIGKPTTPKVRKDGLLILASGSGSIPTLLLVAEQAVEVGAHLAVISAREDSPLYRKAKHGLVLPVDDFIPQDWESNKIVVGTLFEQSLLITLDCVIGEMMEISGQNFADLSARHANLE